MLAELVRTYRQRFGMTQEDLARAASLSVRTVRHIEGSRAARPRPSTVCLLADAFELSGTARAEFQTAALAPVHPGRDGAPPRIHLVRQQATVAPARSVDHVVPATEQYHGSLVTVVIGTARHPDARVDVQVRVQTAMGEYTFGPMAV